MASISQISEPAAVVLTLIAYASLFALTIRQSRKNRPLVLGVVTVATFMGFLFYAYLAGKHTPQWALASVETLIILTGLSVLLLVALDVFRWALAKRASPARGSDIGTK
jgi:hypothetical protein